MMSLCLYSIYIQIYYDDVPMFILIYIQIYYDDVPMFIFYILEIYYDDVPMSIFYILEIYYDDVPMSIQQGYTTLLDSHCTLLEYLVYAKLMKIGYRVSLNKSHFHLLQIS